VIQTPISGPGLVGEMLNGVLYETFRGWPCPEACASGGAHSVPVAVRLVGDSGTSRISWSMDGFRGRLSVSPHSASIGGGDRVLFDSSPYWSEQIGKRVTEEHLALMSDPADGDGVWALRLSFQGGARLIVALGSCDEGEIRYMPDNLVVMGARQVASQYRPVGARTSAWGD
jgi:hypothetical protein